MAKCSFCGKEQSAHKGLHLLKNEGTVNYLCTSKCRNNALKLKRDKRKVRWSEAFHEKREKARTRAKEAEKGEGTTKKKTSSKKK